MDAVAGYHLIKKLATGGMAEIFLARHVASEGFQRNLVIKRILPELARDPQFVQSFLDEARLAAQLNHPNIVQIFDLGSDGGVYYIAMEYVRGFDLGTFLALERRRKGQLPYGLVLSVMRDTLMGLGYAHGATDIDGNKLGIVHRDMTPSNVIVSFAGQAKILDFGIAKATAAGEGRTKTGVFKGKASYVSPEQILGEPLDARADVFSCGVMLYELLTTRNPFRSENEYQTFTRIIEGKMLPFEESRADLSPALQEVIIHALAKERSDRFSSCAELLRAIEQAEPIVATTTDVTSYIAQNEQALGEVALSTDEPGTAQEELSGRVLRVGGTGLDHPVLDTKPPPRRSNIGMIVAVAFFSVLATGLLAWQLIPKPAPFTLPTPVMAAVEITTSPPGAQVLWNGVLLSGTTPIVIEDPPLERTHTFRVIAAGYEPSTDTVRLDSPMRRVISLQLLAKKQVLRASAKPKEPSAPREVVLSGTGMLRLAVKPWATVKIDGVAKGETPLPPIELKAGSHTVVLENSEVGKKVTLPVKIEAGNDTVLRHTF